MTIIKILADENNLHNLESQSHRTECWLDGYIAVPQELEKKAWDCLGYCDLVINDGVLTDILPKEIPDFQKPESLPTINDLIKENELLKAQIKAQSERNDFMEDCIAEMAMQIYN